MGRYLNFRPSKGEIYKETKDDEFFLFKEGKLLVKENTNHIPNRKDIIDKAWDVSHLDCIAGYENKNFYYGILKDENLKGYEYMDLKNYVNSLEDQVYFSLVTRAYMSMNHIIKHNKCGICGGNTYLINRDEERAMVCENCHNMAWPTNSMAIIVAVTKEDKLLLAHNTGFDEGRYSVLAGFVEQGESFEECVKREVEEETNIKVKNIKYFGSQPWPFPNSMMVAFTAEYESGEIEVDNVEISHADWFSKDSLPKVYKNSISIGSALIRWFIENH